MQHPEYSITDFDREIFQDELQDFVPDKVFDAHCHIWSEENADEHTESSILRETYDVWDVKEYNQMLFPGRELGFLFLSSPILGAKYKEDREWCGKQVGLVPNSAGAVAITPGLTPETLASDIETWHFKALKPYLVFSTGVPYDSRITEFMPEDLIEVADHYHQTIVLHLSKWRCASDPDNLEDLTRLTRQYPNVTWQLAHCARNFHGCFMERSIDVLKHLDHIVYDLSAVCNDYTFYLLFKHEDRRRLFYGSDNVVAGGLHGIYAPYSRTWGMFPATPDLKNTCTISLENLRCFRQGAIMAGLTQPEIEDIFFHNAMRHYVL